MSSLTGAMESVSFAVPTGSLKIIDTATGVTVVIVGDLILAGVDLEIDAPTIVVNSGVTIDTRGGSGAGTVLLNATDTQTGSVARIRVGDRERRDHPREVDRPRGDGIADAGPGSIPGREHRDRIVVGGGRGHGSSLLDATGDVTLRSSSSMQATVTSTGTGAFDERRRGGRDG